MPDALPDTPDGNALRNLARHGSDLSRPMVVNFQVAVPSEEAAKSLADAAGKIGYRADVYESPACSLPWTCECSVRIVASIAGIVAAEDELARLAKPFDGFPDGWGSFGNADEKG